MVCAIADLIAISVLFQENIMAIGTGRNKFEKNRLFCSHGMPQNAQYLNNKVNRPKSLALV